MCYNNSIMMKIPKSLEFDTILERLAGKTMSRAAGDAARALTPEETPEGAQLLMRKTMEAETLLLKRPSYPICSFSAAAAELRRMKTGASLSGGELLRLASIFRAAKQAAPLAHDDTAQIIPGMAKRLVYDEGLLRRVEECVLAEDEIADAASSELTRVRRAMRKENEFIREKLQSMIRSQGDSKYLQDSIITQRGGRYVVPVKSEYKSSVPGIVHERSTSGATLFIEPASVVEANNRIRELEAAEAKEIARILAELTSYFSVYREQLKEDVEILTELDLLFAKASLGLEMKAAPVTFTENGELLLRGARHPLINREKVVPISLQMGGGVRALVITGPNTGGKTVTLKLTGLFAAMAQSGLFLPAHTPVKMPVFDGIFADIGDEQSIEQSLSTFSAHMKSIIFALKHAGKNSLVLIDELGAGTDPQEGGALAQAVLKELSDKGCMVIATTHIGELKAFANEREGFENASMEFDAATLTPTYRLLMGVAGHSNAILISKRLGLPAHVVTAAQGYMNAEHLEYGKLIEGAEQAQKKARKLLKDAKEELQQAKEERRKAEQIAQKAAEKRKQVLEKANEKAIEILDDARETAEDAIYEAKQLHKQHDEAGRTVTTQKVRAKLSGKKQVIEQHKKRQIKAKILKEEDIREGDTVTILSMDAPATVLKKPNAKGMVRLQAGIMQVELHYTELGPGQEEAPKKGMRTSHVQLDTRRSVPMEIDLHGMAVDDSLIVLDKYLDDAFLSGLGEVTIIHGRGTGVLRKGVQEYLRTHPHVKSYRPGKYGEGDIGVTVVTLK
ncbi:MAG: endonuclease MutS2 [Christensenella sp.]|nr:endonuclease MutS2 [Christensenella sp.]